MAPTTAIKKRKGLTANGTAALVNGTTSSVAAPALITVSSNAVALIGWEANLSSSSGQGDRLRVVVVDTLYGTIQAVQSFGAGEVKRGGTSGKGAELQMQAAVVDKADGEVALLVGSAVLQIYVDVSHLLPLPLPTEISLHPSTHPHTPLHTSPPTYVGATTV